MRNRHLTFIIIAAGFILCLASQAEAAKASEHKKFATAHRVTAHHRTAAAPRPTLQGGVLVGPLYNGQDYLGDDPDPNIRAYILRDLGSRYGGSD